LLTLLAQRRRLAKILRMLAPAVLANLLFEIAKDVLLAVLAAWLTVKRALREFSSQRWWERQEEAYRKIIDSLSQIQLSLARMSNMGAVFVSIDDQRQHWSTVSEKIEDLKRIFHEGAFRISKASNTAIRELTTNWYPAPPVGEALDQYEMLEQYSDSVNRCRDIIDAEARRDLGLPKQH
jgi:hypothetical protein